MRVKDSKYKYVIVLLSYYRRYKENAFIEIQAQTNDYVEANHIKVSFENVDKKSYIIVNTKEKKWLWHQHKSY